MIDLINLNENNDWGNFVNWVLFFLNKGVFVSVKIIQGVVEI